jgi:hypothetical protein
MKDDTRSLFSAKKGIQVKSFAMIDISSANQLGTVSGLILAVVQYRE